MANTIIAQQHVLVGAYRFTGQVTEIGEALQTNALDATTLGSTTRVHEPGLKGYGLSVGGLWDATVDAMSHTNQRVSNVPTSLCLTGGSVGSPARTFKALFANYTLTGQVGELFKVNHEFGLNTGAPVNGTVMHNTESSGNVTGTAIQLGAVSSTQYLYAALHVFSGTGQFIVKVQSDSSGAFSSPTDVITFATVLTGTAQASEWATPVAGALTDTYWRITATNPNTRDFCVVVGIQ